VRIEVYCGFSFLMSAFIYPVVVGWTWGGGWLMQRGYHDFAGSGVIHMLGGVAGLVGAVIVGPRFGRKDEDI
jgi:Amt family ammonium transporter